MAQNCLLLLCLHLRQPIVYSNTQHVFMNDGRRIILTELFFLSVLEHCRNVTLKWRPVYLLITLHGSAGSHKMILMAKTVL